MRRKIIRIDEEKCNGCGLCIPSCAEGALRIVDGKARLVSDKYCDGLGACLGQCPRGALSIEEREAEEFDEKGVEEMKRSAPQGAQVHETCAEKVDEALPCGCPGTAMRVIERPRNRSFERVAADEGATCSELRQWPVQLSLVPPGAPYLKGADILVAADCVPFAFSGFHERFLKGRALLVACPKLDDARAHLARLIEIIKTADPSALTVVHMEVPCCHGLRRLVAEAVRRSGISVPVLDITIGVEGGVLREEIAKECGGSE